MRSSWQVPPPRAPRAAVGLFWLPGFPARSSGGSGSWFLNPRLQERGSEPRHRRPRRAGGRGCFSQPLESGWEHSQRANAAALPGRCCQGLAWGGLSFTWGGEEGEKATCECRKIFLFFLFFYLETTLVLTMLNTGCIVSLCCCRSVNSVSGKSP